MTTNSHFALSIHILSLMALHDDKPLTSKLISGSINTNPVFVRRILGVLNKAGLVETHLGVGGGTMLARPAEQITLNDVYQAAGCTELFARHHSQPDADCPYGRNMLKVLDLIFQKTEAAVAQTLSTITVADVKVALEGEIALEERGGSTQ